VHPAGLALAGTLLPSLSLFLLLLLVLLLLLLLLLVIVPTLRVGMPPRTLCVLHAPIWPGLRGLL